MSISQQNFEILLHDFKRIGKVVQIITDEKDDEKRKIIADLLRDSMDDLYEDLVKLKGE